MLDRAKVLQALEKLGGELFIDMAKELEIAQMLWQKLSNDSLFALKAVACKTDYAVPLWKESVGQQTAIDSFRGPYAVGSVDGSQIYPDRHEGTSCFLVNIGLAYISYNAAQSAVNFSSLPFPYIELDEELETSVESVNCIRHELELNHLQKLVKTHEVLQQVMLVDGSLIFWHLQGKDQHLRDTYRMRYLEPLKFLFANKVPVVGYISLPKSKDLVNIMRVADELYFNGGYKESLTKLVDIHILRFFLKPGFRTNFFASQVSIAQEYPELLQPYFCYVNVGQEFVRVEMPRWLVDEEKLCQASLAIIMDQVQKGMGYPIILAEAHEQAVVKGHDREFFYQVVKKIAMNSKRKISISQKLRKKRMVGV